MKALTWIIAAVVIVVATVFAVTNRMPVSLDLWPLPYGMTLPLFVVLLGAVIVGFLFGGLAAWWAGRKWRRRARQSASDVERLRRELAAAQRRPASVPASPGAGAPPARSSLPASADS